MMVAVSKALEIYEAEVQSRRDRQHFISLSVDSPLFWGAYNKAKESELRLQNLKTIEIC